MYETVRLPLSAANTNKQNTEIAAASKDTHARVYYDHSLVC